MTPIWALELADAFWQRVGDEAFPRTFARVELALPLTVVRLPALSVDGVREWLRSRSIAMAIPRREQRLCGFLIAKRDYGLVFVDADDDADEQRFTLAHELAHYLRDVWQPRRQAARKFGAQILEVLDGLRPASASELMHGLMRQARVMPVVHLLGRDAPASVAESAADRLAFELLAPAGAVLDRGDLQSRFGLPAGKAAEYAALLWPQMPTNRLIDALVR